MSLTTPAVQTTRCQAALPRRVLPMGRQVRPNNATGQITHATFTSHPLEEPAVRLTGGGGEADPPTSARTILAPSTMARIFPKAISRGRYFIRSRGR